MIRVVAYSSEIRMNSTPREDNDCEDKDSLSKEEEIGGLVSTLFVCTAKEGLQLHWPVVAVQAFKV